MKNYDKLKSHKSAQENMRFSETQKKNIFISITVFCAVFLFLINTCNAQTVNNYYEIKNSYDLASAGSSGNQGTLGIKINYPVQTGLYGFSFNCIRGDATTCQYNLCIASGKTSGTCLRTAVNAVQCASTQTWTGGKDDLFFTTDYKINPPYIMQANTDYWLLAVGTNACSSNFYGTSDINKYNYVSLMRGYESTEFDLASQIIATTTPAETSTSTPSSACPDCTNNCFCGSISGATTSTSTIFNDSFLDDSDISTIKSVSGIVGDKNYTIYYSPFLLFIYIFILLFVSLIIIYIYRIIRKK